FVKNGIAYFGAPNTLGIKNYDLDNKNLIAYPNPAHSTLNLNITERSTVRLINSLGEEIHKSVIDPGNSIDTGSFPAGIYILLIETNHGPYTQKLVIEH
ncbi:MAG: T9SS type A sorting domain-containing protein, partial [Bacteroidia bacterium]